jgi:hypothetical protein
VPRCTFHIGICPAASWLRFAFISRSCSLYRRFDIGQGNLHTLSHAAVLARLRFRPDNMGHHAQGIPNNARCTQTSLNRSRSGAPSPRFLFKRFVNFAQTFAREAEAGLGRIILLVLDNAGWHANLKIPDGRLGTMKTGEFSNAIFGEN